MQLLQDEEFIEQNLNPDAFLGAVDDLVINNLLICDDKEEWQCQEIKSKLHLLMDNNIDTELNDTDNSVDKILSLNISDNYYDHTPTDDDQSFHDKHKPPPLCTIPTPKCTTHQL